MQDKDKDQFVDALLEASMRRSRSVEPRTGLEGRILAHVSASERAGWRWTWAWALGAAAAGVLVILAILQFHQHPAPGPSPNVVVVEKSAPHATPPQTTEMTSPKQRLQAARRPALRAPRSVAPPPRPAQFPTPAPLNEDELRLLMNSTRGPGAESVADQKSGGIEPMPIPRLEIVALEIKPVSLNDDVNRF